MRIRLLDPAASQGHADARLAAVTIVEAAALPPGHLLAGGALLGHDLATLVCLIRYQAAIHCSGLDAEASQHYISSYTESFLRTLQGVLAQRVASPRLSQAARKEVSTLQHIVERAVECLQEEEVEPPQAR